MLPYQEAIVGEFLGMLGRDVRRVLEIGSDLEVEVASALASRRGLSVVATNLDAGFPAAAPAIDAGPRILRADGRLLPFPDASFDAALSLATLEHVDGIERFLAEAARVLRPEGLLYLHFGPVWSCAVGHHVYAVAGGKEARFWKPGRNPVPGYGHLLMSPEEMERELRAGPCAEELIPAVVDWVYRGPALNRLHIEEYLSALRACPLAIDSIRKSGDFAADEATRVRLEARYGPGRDFGTTLVTALLRKPPEDRPARTLFEARLKARRGISRVVAGARSELGRRVPELRWLVRRLRRANR